MENENNVRNMENRIQYMGVTVQQHFRSENASEPDKDGPEIKLIAFYDAAAVSGEQIQELLRDKIDHICSTGDTSELPKGVLLVDESQAERVKCLLEAAMEYGKWYQAMHS